MDSPFTFVYVSGEGATQKPGMLTPIFGRIKGETETALFEFGQQNPMFKLYNVRPGGVDCRPNPWFDFGVIKTYANLVCSY